MEDNKQRPGMKPGNDGQTPRKGPRFNIYWIYGIILVGILGVQFFGSSMGSSAKEQSFQDFRNNYLDKGLVDHVIVVNNESVEVYLKASAQPQQPQNSNKLPSLNINNEKSA